MSDAFRAYHGPDGKAAKTLRSYYVGDLTAPTIFALKANSELRGLIENQFENEGDLQKAIDIVGEHGIEEARQLAKREGDIALASLRQLPDSESKRSLQAMVGYVLERIY